MSLESIAHPRLHPLLSDPSYLVLRSRRLIFSRWICELGNRRDLNVLDVGGRYQPYRPLLANRVARYTAVDLIKTELVNVVANGDAPPFGVESFDLAIATQVLEYRPDPAIAVREIFRVLKPSGVLLASAPSFAPRFVDEECWRFTRRGLSSMLSLFSEVKIVPELYSVGSFCRALNLVGDTFVRFRFARSIYRRTACPILNLLGLGVEKLNLTSNEQFAANYSVFATK